MGNSKMNELPIISKEQLIFLKIKYWEIIKNEVENGARIN